MNEAMLHPFDARAYLSLFSLITLHIAALTVRPNPWRWTFWPLILFCTIHLMQVTTGNFFADYVYGSGLVSSLLTATDYILLTEVQRDFWVIGKKEWSSIESKPLWTRFQWACSLMQTQTGVGWNWEPKGLSKTRPPPGTTRPRFISKQFLRAIILVLLLDMSTAYNQTSDGWIRESWNRSDTISFQRSLGDLASFGISAFAGIDLTLVLTSIFHVLLHMSSPEEWAPAFGNIFDAYTVRRFWNHVWHKTVRRTVSLPGIHFTTNILKLNKRSVPALLIQLYSAFLISAVMHSFADFKLHGGVWQHSQSFVLFGAQPLIITLEEALLYIGRRVGLRGNWGWKIVGYCWTLGWFIFLVPMWWTPMADAGLAALSEGQVTLTERAWRWVTDI